MSVPGGSHSVDDRSARASQNPHEGGDKRQWQRKPRAGRRRPARSGKLTSPVKKGGGRRPLFNFQTRFVVVPSQILTRRITSHCSIRSTTSMPAITRPKTVYFAFLGAASPVPSSHSRRRPEAPVRGLPHRRPDRLRGGLRGNPWTPRATARRGQRCAPHAGVGARDACRHRGGVRDHGGFRLRTLARR